MTQNEDYERGYQDALAHIRNEIEQRIAEQEKFLEQFSKSDYVSSVAAEEHNIKVGLNIAKIVIDKEIKRR